MRIKELRQFLKRVEKLCQPVNTSIDPKMACSTYIRHEIRHLTCTHARADTARSICLAQEGPEAGVEFGNEVFGDSLQLDVQIFLGGVFHFDMLGRNSKV